MQHWKTTLERALALRPEHFSLYSLIIEEGTNFSTPGQTKGDYSRR